MSVVKNCYDVTKQLLTFVKDAEIDREAQIEQIDRMLDNRAELLPRIKPPFTMEEMQIGKELNVLNKQLDAYLRTMKQRVQFDINSLDKQRKSTHKYANPYASIQNDGIYYDKRK